MELLHIYVFLSSQVLKIWKELIIGLFFVQLKLYIFFLIRDSEKAKSTKPFEN